MADIVVNKWKREQYMDMRSIIHFQLLVHCHLMGIKMSPERLNCLTLIGMQGKLPLKPFTVTLAELGIFASPQSARNIIDSMEQEKLLVKEGTYRKDIYLHPDMKIQSKGNILLEIKCFHRE